MPTPREATGEVVRLLRGYLVVVAALYSLGPATTSPTRNADYRAIDGLLAAIEAVGFDADGWPVATSPE